MFSTTFFVNINLMKYQSTDMYTQIVPIITVIREKCNSKWKRDIHIPSIFFFNLTSKTNYILCTISSKHFISH